MRIEGYMLISWHDRADGRQGGGVAVFALKNVAHKVTHLGGSSVEERSWVVVHSDRGPDVIDAGTDLPHLERESIRSPKEGTGECCAWRSQRPSSEVVEVLQQEQLGRRRIVLQLQRDRTDTTHPRTHSRRTSARPGAFQCPCVENRSSPDDCRSQASYGHVEALSAISCRGWTQGVLRDMLDDTCWDHLRSLSTTDAAKWVTDTVLRVARSCIPLTTLRARKSTHPWFNDRGPCIRPAGCTGTPMEMETMLACGAELPAQYRDFIFRTAQKMRELKLSSKLWWKAKEVMKHEVQVSSIPFKTDGVWVLDAQGKASSLTRLRENVATAKTERLHRVSPMPGNPRIFCFSVREVSGRSCEPQ